MQFKTWLNEDWTHKGWTSSDNTVNGDLDIDDHFNLIGIWNWHSMKQGEGNSVKALQELRTTYPNYKIHVLSAMDEAIPYWQIMAKRGLIDKISDTNDQQIYP